MVVDFAEGGNRIPRLRVFDRTMADDIDDVRLARVGELRKNVIDAHRDGIRIVDVHVDQRYGRLSDAVRNGAAVIQREIQLPATRVVDGKRQMAAIVRSLSMCQALRREHVLSDQLRACGESKRLGRDDAGAQAGEWRRSDADDDAGDVRRLQSGLFDGLRDVHLQFLDMGARIRFDDGFMSDHAYGRTI